MALLLLVMIWLTIPADLLSLKLEQMLLNKKVYGVTGPGHVYSDESDTETDTIHTGELPGKQNLSTDPLPTDSPINQQQSNLDANQYDGSPSILHQQ